MFPSATVNLNAYPVTANDPPFSPVAAEVAQLDSWMAIAAVSRRIGGDPQSLSIAFAPELALTRSILFNYPLNQTSVPPTPAGKIDVCCRLSARRLRTRRLPGLSTPPVANRTILRLDTPPADAPVFVPAAVCAT